MTTTTKKLATGELALKVFTDALHHDEALRDPYRVPKRLHDDMVSALDDLRDLLADRDDTANRLGVVQQNVITLTKQLDNAALTIVELGEQPVRVVHDSPSEIDRLQRQADHWDDAAHTLQRENEALRGALRRAVPWLGKMIADGGHLESVAPNDAVGALEQAEAALGLRS